MKVDVKLWKFQELLSHTSHSTEGSLAAEKGACSQRIAKNQATHYEVIEWGKTEVFYS